MDVHRSAAGVAVRAPAKLNLFFEVLGKRSDGFHEIETLMVPINLFDDLHFQPDATGRISVECRWAGLDEPGTSRGDLPAEAENIATRALQLLRRRAGLTAGARVQLLKRIPSAAGLGGGSSDAAAALLAGNAGWQLNWPRRALLPLAAELGSDVPFFLARSAAVCRGRGERIEPVDGLGCLDFVLVRPPAGLSTARVYANCRAAQPPQPLEPLVRALAKGDRRLAGRLLYNRLEEAAEPLSPWIGRLKAEFARLDCPARMSGSGSSYFGMCRGARHARRVAARLRSRGVGRVYAVHSCGRRHLGGSQGSFGSRRE